MLTHVDRVLAVIAAMLLFTWHELVLFHDRPTAADPSRGQVIAATTRVFGETDPFYLTQFDMAVRFGLVSLVVGLALWAVVCTLRRSPQQETTRL